MSWKTLCSQIDPACLKRNVSVDEYRYVQANTIRVNATDLYEEFGEGMTYPEFYTMLKQHLYYDKFICLHGTEFYYYIQFKEPRKENIRHRDVLCIICAVGDNYVQRYI